MADYDRQQFWDDATREHYEAGVAIGRVRKMLERYEHEDMEMGLTFHHYRSDEIEEGIDCPF